MNRTKLPACGLLLTAGVVAAVVAAAAPLAATPPVDGRKATWDRYSLIVSRNIFSRDRRGPSRERPAFTSRTDYSPRPERPVVLTGIAFQEGQYLAFFEDPRAAQPVWATVGQAVFGGWVKSISLDSVVFQSGSSTRTIAIGQSLEGEAVMLGATAVFAEPTTTTSSAPATGPGAASGPGDTGNLSMEERMRLRRLQENK